MTRNAIGPHEIPRTAIEIFNKQGTGYLISGYEIISAILNIPEVRKLVLEKEDPDRYNKLTILDTPSIGYDE